MKNKSTFAQVILLILVAVTTQISHLTAHSDMCQARLMIRMKVLTLFTHIPEARLAIRGLVKVTITPLVLQVYLQADTIQTL